MKNRKRFMYNEGRMRGGTGYFQNALQAFHAFREFLPMKVLNISSEDFPYFAEGFNELHEMRLTMLKLKVEAQEENTGQLRELEAQGLTFTVNDIHS